MNKKQSVLLQRTYIVLVFCFMYLPIAVMIAFSFNQSKSRSYFTGFTLDWYKSLFHNEMILSALGSSLVLALAGLALTGALAALALTAGSVLAAAVTVLELVYLRRSAAVLGGRA